MAADPVNGIPVAEIVSALSFALDLTEDAVPGHALRSCLLGMRLAGEIGLPDAQRCSLFYALLLKDVGCSSNAARLWRLMGSDERSFKNAARFEDWSRPNWSSVQMLWRHMYPEAPTGKRLLHMVRLSVRQRRTNQEVFALRCERGAGIVQRIGLGEEAAQAVRHVDEAWDGTGYPDQLGGESIPLLSRLLLTAQHLDVFGTGYGNARAVDLLEGRGGRTLDPQIVRAARSLHQRGVLWQEMEGGDVRQAVLDLEPGQRLVASRAQIDRICDAFADVVDVKSSFTGTHSRSVTTAALRIAVALGLSPERQELVSRASLLHDLGKLRVPNSILDKAGGLSSAEWTIMREHPRLTTEILARVGHFRELAEIAGQHHEKLDGSGYPYQLRANALSLEARLIAVADVYTALAEERPYREGLQLKQIRTLMDKEAGAQLDRTCYEALLATLPDTPEHP